MTNGLTQSAEEIVTEISMSDSKNPWLIVEGASDGVFFSTKTLSKPSNVVVALGWENVVGVISKIVEESIAKSVFGFIDRDYRDELGIVVQDDYIVKTDFRDLEISLFESTALHRLIVEYGSKFKLPKASNDCIDIETVKHRIYSVAHEIGRLRYFSLKSGLNFSIKKLDFSKFIDERTLALNKSNLVAQLNSNSKSRISLSELEEMLVAELPSRLLDSKNLCSGHDVIELLGISLRKMWGTNNSGDVCRERLEKFFRIGYSHEEFSKTEMFNKLSVLLDS